MIKAYGYLRVSGKGQLDGDGFVRQEGAIRKHAAANGIEIVRFFQEKAVPGATEWADRPAWLEMIEMVNGARTIVIEKLDRVARDLMVQEHIIADLKKRGIALVSTEEPDLDSDNPTRVLMRQIMGAIAQYDKAMIVLKLRGSRERARARGEQCEGRKPYGSHAGEGDVVIHILARAAEGDSAMSIARSLNEEGIRSRSGKEWHPYVVSRILQKHLKK